MRDHASESASGGPDLLRAPGGSPRAGVRGAHCGGCHLRLLPRLLQQIRRNGSVIGCPHCGRLLFHEALSSPGGADERRDSARDPGSGDPAERRPPSRRVARLNRGSRKPDRLSLATKGR
ncbi:MAG: C4-type zinc ribbon domain-containing protein [Syntrophomonadaceae bacterium]